MHAIVITGKKVCVATARGPVGASLSSNYTGQYANSGALKCERLALLVLITSEHC